MTYVEISVNKSTKEIHEKTKVKNTIKFWLKKILHYFTIIANSDKDLNH